MLFEKSVFIKESDEFGNLKMVGADLSADLVDSLFAYILVKGGGHVLSRATE